MKKTLIALSLVFASSAIFGFGFGDLTKAISDTAEAVAGTGQADAFLAKQKDLVANYAESKQKYAKGCQYIAQSLNNEKLLKQCEEIAASVDTSKTTDVKTIAQSTDKLVSGADASALYKPTTTALTDAAKAKYSEGLGQFEDSLKLLIKVGTDTPALVKEGQDIIANASEVDKIKMTKSIEPTIDLGKQIVSDTSKIKSEISKIVSAAKAMGINVPQSLEALLK